MTKSKIVWHSLGHALLVLGYITCVALLINYLSHHFARPDGIIEPISALMLLVLSAAVMAILVFGRPVMLYLNGAKKEAVQFLAYQLGWMLLLVIIIFATSIFYLGY